MCLIAVTPKRELVPIDHLKNAQARNSDGWGVMYALDGVVHTVKSMEGFDAFLLAWEAIPEGTPCAAHFRFATHGAKDAANCHPFRVLDGLYVMHNGPSAMDCKGDDKRSDTAEMVTDILRPILLGMPRKIRKQSFQRLLKNAMGAEKLVFLEACGKWHFVNQDQGTVQNGVWYSNGYSITPRPAPVTPSKYAGYQGSLSDYDRGDWGYYGGSGYAGSRSALVTNSTVEPSWNPSKHGFVKNERGVWVKPKWQTRADPNRKCAERDYRVKCDRGCTYGATCQMILERREAEADTLKAAAEKAERLAKDAAADAFDAERVKVGCKASSCNCVTTAHCAFNGDTLKLSTPASLARELTWTERNLAAMNGHELLEACQIDPEGAADYIGASLSSGAWRD